MHMVAAEVWLMKRVELPFPDQARRVTEFEMEIFLAGSISGPAILAGSFYAPVD